MKIDVKPALHLFQRTTWHTDITYLYHSKFDSQP